MSSRRTAALRQLAAPVVVLAALLWCAPALAGDEPPAAAAYDPPTVAIADLDNHTGDPALDGAGAGVAAVLISKFARVDAIQVVERARLHELIGEMELARGGVVDPATAAEAGKVVGADFLVLGSLFSVQLPTVAVTLRVVSVETGEVVASEDVTGAIGGDGEEFFVLIDELAFQILDGMRVRLASRERIELGQIDVRKMETVQVYGDALHALDRGDRAGAEGHLARAVALEPGFRLAEETLAQLASEIRHKKSVYAHESIDIVHGYWDQIRAEVAPVAADPQPTLRDLAYVALHARLLLVDGRFDEYLAQEQWRAETTAAHIDSFREASTYPHHDFFRHWRDVVDATGCSDQAGYTFMNIEFWPHEVQAQRADVMARLGRTEEAMALAIENYQHPGPLERPEHRAEHPVNLAGRWGMHDVQVTLVQQWLRQRELAGDEEGERKILKMLEDDLEDLREGREDRERYEQIRARLAREPVSVALVNEEERYSGAAANQADLTLAGYQAFCRRVEDGYYDPVRETDEFEDLADYWRRVADRHWDERWYVERRLQHLLTYQAQVPAADDEQAEEYRLRLERFVTGAYHR